VHCERKEACWTIWQSHGSGFPGLDRKGSAACRTQTALSTATFSAAGPVGVDRQQSNANCRIVGAFDGSADRLVSSNLKIYGLGQDGNQNDKNLVRDTA